MENELSIKLDQRPSGLPFYTHGDLVRGCVVLSQTPNARGIETSFTFKGTAKSQIMGSSISTESCLFHFHKPSCDGHKQGRGNDRTYIWPFKFSFPSVTQSTSWKQRYSGDADFHRDPGHALPPSWPEGSRIENGDGHNSIRYTLEIVITNNVTKSASRKESIVLPFCAVREMEDYHPILTPIEHPLSRTTPLLDPRFQGHEHTIAGHSIALHQPTSHFNIRVGLPEIICAGGRIPIFIGVEHDRSRSTAPITPLVYLKRITITLETCTRVRGPAGFLALGPEPQESWSKSKILVDSGLLNLALCDRADVHEIVKGLATDGDLTPTFKTYNIARTYNLHINIEIECAQKVFSFQLDRKLCLLPSICKTIDTPARRPQQCPTIQSPPDAPPPPYEEVETETYSRLASVGHAMRSCSGASGAQRSLFNNGGGFGGTC